MSGLTTRVLSALAALLLLAGVTYWWGIKGLAVLAQLVIIVGITEFISISLLKPELPKPVAVVFFISALLSFWGVLSYTSFGFLILAATSSLFIAGGLWLCRGKVQNHQLLSTLAIGVLGLLYFVGFPALAVKTLLMNHGAVWFAFLLIVVFFGDTFAYFGGRFLGNKKLMPEVSPKKTVAGAYTGLIGSVVGGSALLAYFLPAISPLWTALFCLLCGFFAQSGDLFVSLIKRVANVKDSGKIMPGHGGVLDRLDGVYIAAPLVYIFARLCEHFFAV